GQQVRQPVSGLLQLAIGPRTLPTGQRDRLGCACDLGGEQHRNRHRRRCGLGQHPPVADLIEAGLLSLLEPIHPPEPPPPRRRPGSAVIATTTRCNRSISVSMLSASNTSVSNSTRRPSSWPGKAATVSG